MIASNRKYSKSSKFSKRADGQLLRSKEGSFEDSRSKSKQNIAYCRAGTSVYVARFKETVVSYNVLWLFFRAGLAYNKMSKNCEQTSKSEDFVKKTELYERIVSPLLTKPVEVSKFSW